MSTELVTTEAQEIAPKPQKAIVLADDRGLKFGSMDEMARFCQAVVNSGQFKDISSPEVALIRLQAGLELGLTPIWSLANIMVQNGRPSVWGDALLALILSRPDCEDVIETSEGEGESLVATCEVRRKGRVPVIRTFSAADAKKAGLTNRGVHATYPKRMLQMRARSWACRDAFADALRGLGCAEETFAERPAKVREVTGIVLPEEGQE